MWDYLALPETALLIVSMIILILSGLFERIAERSVEVDSEMVKRLKASGNITDDEAKEPLWVYSRDIGWRVGMLTSLISGVLAVLAAAHKNTWPFLLNALIVLALVITVLVVLTARHPYRLKKRRLWQLGLTGYGIGKLVVFGLYLVTFGIGYCDHAPRHCPDVPGLFARLQASSSR